MQKGHVISWKKVWSPRKIVPASFNYIKMWRNKMVVWWFEQNPLNHSSQGSELRATILFTTLDRTLTERDEVKDNVLTQLIMTISLDKCVSFYMDPIRVCTWIWSETDVDALKLCMWIGVTFSSKKYHWYWGSYCMKKIGQMLR